MSTKELILSTAFKLFAAGNFESVSMSQLEKLTGLSKGAFYHHFKSKEEIFIQAMNLFFFAPDGAGIESSDSLDLESWIRFRCNAASRHAKWLKKQFGIDMKAFNTFGLMTTALRHYPDIHEKIKFQQDSELMIWEKKIRAAQSLGAINPSLDQSVLARLFAGITDGISFRCILRGEQARSESEAIEMCLGLLKIGNSVAHTEVSVQEDKKEKEKKGPQMLTLF